MWPESCRLHVFGLLGMILKSGPGSRFPQFLASVQCPEVAELAGSFFCKGMHKPSARLLGSRRVRVFFGTQMPDSMRFRHYG